MDILTARGFTNTLCWYRDRDLPAAEPMQVRIMSTSERSVRVSTQLDGSRTATPDECFTVDPDELHFEVTGFDVHDTEPAPMTKTDPCPPSEPFSDRFVDIEVIRARR